MEFVKDFGIYTTIQSSQSPMNKEVHLVEGFFSILSILASSLLYLFLVRLSFLSPIVFERYEIDFRIRFQELQSLYIEKRRKKLMRSMHLGFPEDDLHSLFELPLYRPLIEVTGEVSLRILIPFLLSFSFLVSMALSLPPPFFVWSRSLEFRRWLAGIEGLHMINGCLGRISGKLQLLKALFVLSINLANYQAKGLIMQADDVRQSEEVAGMVKPVLAALLMARDEISFMGLSFFVVHRTQV